MQSVARVAPTKNFDKHIWECKCTISHDISPSLSCSMLLCTHCLCLSLSPQHALNEDTWQGNRQCGTSYRTEREDKRETHGPLPLTAGVLLLSHNAGAQIRGDQKEWWRGRVRFATTYLHRQTAHLYVQKKKKIPKKATIKIQQLQEQQPDSGLRQSLLRWRAGEGFTWTQAAAPMSSRKGRNGL